MAAIQSYAAWAAPNAGRNAEQTLAKAGRVGWRCIEFCLAWMTVVYYTGRMKSLTVRLPDQLVKEIEAESRERDCAKSDVVRERLQRGAGTTSSSSARLNLIADLIGSVDGLPADMSGRRKRYLKTTGYGKKRAG